ncbi:MAG: ankyrin repeat domain-containing protein, partial [Desulfobacterales bacterium]
MEHKKHILKAFLTHQQWRALVLLLLIAMVSCKGEAGRRLPDPQALLMKAAEKGDLALAQKAVTEGADIHAQLGHRADETWTALLLVMSNCHNGQRYVDVARFLLDQGADVNVRSGSGTTPLMKAFGNVEMLKLLLEYGADIQARDHDGMTAVGYAAQYGQNDAVMFLIRHGADIHVTTHSGKTLLILAVGLCEPPVIQYLLDHGL